MAGEYGADGQREVVQRGGEWNRVGAVAVALHREGVRKLGDTMLQRKLAEVWRVHGANRYGPGDWLRERYR